MKIRLSAFSDEAGVSLAEQIDALQANRIAMTELRSVDNKNVAELSLSEAKEIYSSLSCEGISLSAVGSPMGKVNISVNIDEYLDTVKHICELANVFNTDKIRMFSFFESHAQGDRVVEYLNRMVEVANSYGVGLYHENEKGIYGDTAARVLELRERVKGLHFVYDPANFLQVGECADKTLPLLLPITDYFHIKDVVSEGGELVPAGEGDGQIARMVSMIEKDTFMTLEPHLKVFSGYDKIDGEVMKHKFHFESNREAFDYAVGALRGILINNGYTEKDGGFVK